MLESSFEKYVCDCIKKCGGRAFKWASPGCSGVPDRLCVMPNGKVIFIEVKRPGLKDGTSPRQKKIIRDLKAKGHTAWVVSEKLDLLEKLRGLGYEI